MGLRVGATKPHFMSKIDLILLPGTDPAKLYVQHTHYNGQMPLPLVFSLGYHQVFGTIKMRPVFSWNMQTGRDTSCEIKRPFPIQRRCR
jgi:hypothetical protein